MTGAGPCLASEHGTALAYYRRGCRCPDARELYRIYRKRLREGRSVSPFVATTGTTRRLQSLVASGYSQAALGARLGVSGQRIYQWLKPTKTGVSRLTEQRIKQLFHELDGTDGASRYARTAAKRNGWFDAAAWDDIDDPGERPKLGRRGLRIVDQVKVQRAIHGEPLQLSPRERRLAVDTLTRYGLSQTQIAARLFTTGRSVCRHRSRARQLTAA